MSEPSPAGANNRECYGCGRGVKKYVRVDQGEGYCGSCYARLFKKRLCPKCSQLARLPSRIGAVCKRCEHVGKPCARCGKVNFEIGKVTSYGPVCNACSPYFRKPRPCGRCGTLSTRLSRVSRLGIDEQVCPACQQSDYACCSACGKHRQLTGTERKLCKTCHEKGVIACSTCGESTPAGYGKICKNCYLRNLLAKRVAMDRASFADGQMAQLFDEFASWLLVESGAHKATTSIHRFQEFFSEVENLWGGVPDYKVLLKHYGTLGLRRRELPMRFFVRTGRVVVDPAARNDQAMLQQIEVLLNTLSAESRASSLLVEYHRHLERRLAKGEISMKSIRLAITPAVALLKDARLDQGQSVCQQDLDRYLERVPGQRAAISGFIGFLRKHIKLELTLPPKADNAKAKQRFKRGLELQLVALLTTGGSGVLYAQKLIGTALAYFHGLKKIAIKNAQRIRVDVSTDRSGVTVYIDELACWLPAEFVDASSMIVR